MPIRGRSRRAALFVIGGSMTAPAGYTAEEWECVAAGPMMVGMFMIAAGHAGLWEAWREGHSALDLVRVIWREGPLRILREARAGAETIGGGHISLIQLLRGEFGRAFAGTRPLPGD